MNRISRTLFCGHITWLLMLLSASINAQESWPHSVRNWDDPLFQARVQGVYDWIGSGPDRLSQYDYFTQADGMVILNSVPFYRRTTENRDLDTFPPRARIDPDAQFIAEPKDWTDRERLIAYMVANDTIEEGFFEDVIDGDADADSYYLLGNVHFMQGRYTQAVVSYEEALRRYRNFRLAQQNLAYSYYILQDCDKALEAATAAVELGAMSARVRGVQASCALIQGRVQTAMAAIEFARIVEPQNLQWKRLEIRIMIAAGRTAQAEKHLLNDISNTALTEFHLLSLVDLYRKRDDRGLLMSMLEIGQRAGILSQALVKELIELKIAEGLGGRLSPAELEAYADDPLIDGDQVLPLLHYLADHAQADAYLALSDNLLELMSIESMENERYEVLLGQAGVLFRDSEYESALSKVHEVLQSSPLHCEALIQAAEIYGRLAQGEQANKLLLRVEYSSPDCADTTLMRQARIQSDLGDYALSLELYQRDARQRAIENNWQDRWQRTLMRELTQLATMTAQ